MVLMIKYPIPSPLSSTNTDATPGIPKKLPQINFLVSKNRARSCLLLHISIRASVIGSLSTGTAPTSKYTTITTIAKFLPTGGTCWKNIILQGQSFSQQIFENFVLSIPALVFQYVVMGFPYEMFI